MSNALGVAVGDEGKKLDSDDLGEIEKVEGVGFAVLGVAEASAEGRGVVAADDCASAHFRRRANGKRTAENGVLRWFAVLGVCIMMKFEGVWSVVPEARLRSCQDEESSSVVSMESKHVLKPGAAGASKKDSVLETCAREPVEAELSLDCLDWWFMASNRSSHSVLPRINVLGGADHFRPHVSAISSSSTFFNVEYCALLKTIAIQQDAQSY